MSQVKLTHLTSANSAYNTYKSFDAGYPTEQEEIYYSERLLEFLLVSKRIYEPTDNKIKKGKNIETDVNSTAIIILQAANLGFL